jgi:hypothetical protein
MKAGSVGPQITLIALIMNGLTFFNLCHLRNLWTFSQGVPARFGG